MTWKEQFVALVRKNFILQKRKPWGVVVQLVLPALFYLAFGIIRATLLPPETGKAIPFNNPLPVYPIAYFVRSAKYAYYPESADVRSIMEKSLEFACERENPNNQAGYEQCLSELTPQLIGFTNADRLEDYLKDNEDSVWAAVGFVDSKGKEFGGPFTTRVDYRLRVDGTGLPYSTEKFQEVEIGPTDSGEQYLYSGFVPLQITIDVAIARYKTGNNSFTIDLSAQEYPYPEYTTNEFYTAVSQSIAFYTCLSFVYFVIRLVNQIVTEKETKIKEAMKIMGLSDIVYWSTWYFSSFSIMITAMLLLSIAAKISTVYEKSDFLLIFIFYGVWGLAIISFCFLISVFFNKSKVASAVSVIILFVSLVPNISIDGSSSAGAQFVGCLLAPTCLALGTEKFCDQEDLKIGITWDNVNEGTMSYTGLVWTMIFDIFLYAFLAWYLEQVLPREHGIRRKWYFLFQLSYWRPATPYDKFAGKKSYSTFVDEDEVDDDTEGVPSSIASKATVHIKKLRKDFSINTHGTPIIKTAVKNLNLVMYEDQITALLGHNGAGKTTTMSMLTGFVAPTSGDAVIYGSSILNDIEKIRENIGYCPQHNVLWDDLTVEEHIHLFAALKGVPVSERDSHVAERIREVGLDEKTGSYSRTLSGGQKRKLCVAIAFTGGTKLIFLDEPTSGMDPFSRRAVWDLLQKLKSGRTIVLTTHFMDEADLLGDRIAIMSRGRLAACGSSLYLKTRYGVGYSLTMVKKASCKESAVTDYLRQFDPAINVLSNVGAELAYVLPRSAMKNFGKLFTQLEKDKTGMNIDSYGLSVTTLEEVFLRLADRVEEEDTKEKRLSQANAEAVAIPMDRILSGKMTANKFYDGEIKYERSYWQQFKALLMKRFLVSMRDSKALFQMLFYPTVFVLLAVVVSNTIPSDRNTEILNLNYSELDKYNQFLYWDNTTATGSVSTLLNDYAVKNPAVKLVELPSGNDINEYILDNSDIRVSSIFRKADTSSGYSYTAMYDTTAFHSLPIGINYVNNAIIRQFLNDQSFQIVASNLPLPVFDLSVSDYAKSFNLALYVGIAVCIIPGALITSIVREREVKATHQQLVSGAKSVLLWVTYLIADLVLFMLFCCVIFIIFAASNTEAYIGRNFGATAVVLLAFGLSVFPFTYLLSFVVKNPSATQTKITTWYIVFSLASLIIISILYSTTSTRDAAEYVDYLFTLVPPYAVAIGIFNISINDISDGIPGEERKDPFDWDIAGRTITFMFLESVVFSLILVLFEKGYFDKFLYPPEPVHILDKLADEADTDEDVLAEQDRIEKQSSHSDAVVVKDLRKVYSNDLVTKIAVKKLSFGIPEGECFGLLGPNGAGKTTTLSILSGELPPTAGDVWLSGKSILGNKREIFEVISLCPQFDPLLDLMTGREHLYLFGRLRGVPEDKLDVIVENALTILDLEQHADKLTEAYSGGNKRKLSLAIAMLGDPKILFLDEPSTGMDPLARRFMWNVISSFIPGRSIILTTHSMEECEALCTRIGIMVNGRMKCLGGSQHLKNKFGSGYRLEIQTSNEMVDKVRSFIQSIFHDANLLEWHSGKLRYQISAQNMNLGTVFESIEARREELKIEDYALSQTTLEQVFVNFAQQQEAEAIPPPDAAQE